MDNVNGKENLFCGQITVQSVFSDMVIVKYKLTYEKNEEIKNVKTITTLDTINSFNEIKTIIINNFIHKGIKLSCDGRMEEFEYIQTPFEKILLADDYKNYEIYEYEMYTNILSMCIKKNNTELNIGATYIANTKIYGDVYLSLTENPTYTSGKYLSLTDNMLKMMINIRKKGESLTNFIDIRDKEYINFEYLLKHEEMIHKGKSDIITE